MEKQLTPQEKWDRATFADNFIFYKVLHENPEVCKELLEILLEIEIEHIEMYQEEQFKIDYESKGIRLDVYAKNEENAFNVEMQTQNTRELPERARYYTGVMDVDNLKSGDIYKNLKTSYVIFICLDDIFGKGLPVYTFENFCRQDKEHKLGDRAYKYFFIAGNCGKIENQQQRDFFNLLINNQVSNSFTKKLKRLAENVKHNFEWRKQFMEWDRIKAYARYEGAAEGYIEGLEEGKLRGLEEGKLQGLEEGKLQGLEEGKLQGLEEGKLQGLEEGKLQGLEEGKLKNSKDTAINLIKMNVLSFEQIAEAVNLSLEEVKEIAEKEVVLSN